MQKLFACSNEPIASDLSNHFSSSKVKSEKDGSVFVRLQRPSGGHARARPLKMSEGPGLRRNVVLPAPEKLCVRSRARFALLERNEGLRLHLLKGRCGGSHGDLLVVLYKLLHVHELSERITARNTRQPSPETRRMFNTDLRVHRSYT